MKIKISTLLRNNGCITVNKYLIHAVGLNEAILYSELASRYEYFADRNKLDDEGYFYNTQYDLQAGTGLGEKAQRTAINKLKKIGLINVKRKGIPAKRYFTIVGNDDLLLELLGKGKEKLLSLESSTDTSIGGNLKLRKKELDIAERSANNTKVNNTNNNTNLHHLNELNDEYVFSYLEIMDQYGYKHKRVTTDNMQYIINAIETIRSYDIDIKEWIEAVNEHFNNLPKNNDGDIMAFLKASFRYFEIDLER